MCCQVSITNQDESQWLVASYGEKKGHKERTVKILSFAMKTTSFEVRLAIALTHEEARTHCWRTGPVGLCRKFFSGDGPTSPRAGLPIRSYAGPTV